MFAVRAELLALPAWPAERLRLVIERWQPDVEVRIDRQPRESDQMPCNPNALIERTR